MHEIDIRKLNQVYQQETGQENQTQQRHASEEASTLLGAPRRSLDLDDIADTFCEAWPKAHKFFKWAFVMASWFPGMSSIIVMAKGVVSAIDKQVVPIVCALEAADDAGTPSEASARTETPTKEKMPKTPR